MSTRPTRLERVRELFEQAAAQPPDCRSAFIASVCGQDEELRAEVETLLEHDSSAGDFLQPRLADVGIVRELLAEASPQEDSLVGQRVGHYQVQSVLARGGMATVYEAVQSEPHRVVALKVMHRHLASRSVLRRFQFEAEVLGRLRHPNVAQVFEAGLHGEGPAAIPFFAMEYVPGARAITQYARERELSVRCRVELWVKVCDAVHHAHQKGVIHRDLKPANILADAAGEPKVIDFGVARVTDSDMALTAAQTSFGQLIGTMQYMSPEQCDGDPLDLDIRSDVYSLGVVLYELLTEQLPYEATRTTVYGASRAIKEQEPRRPALLQKALRGDLEAIILKALAKRRERRYQSAADLARDLRHWLNREPIEARPPTAWARVVRWTARRPVTVTAVVCGGIVVLTAIATVFSVWMLNMRPSGVVVDAENQLVIVQTVSGKPIQRWGGGSAQGCARIGAPVGVPPAFGGGTGVVVGFANAEGALHPRALCLYSFGDLTKPAWHKGVETADLPSELRQMGIVGGDFCVVGGTVADVFPDYPAGRRAVREIVAVYARSGSARLIRIYDLSGEPLYEVWHDGSADLVYWMSAPGLLVFAGDNAEDDDKQLPAGHAPYSKPRVIFAIKPELGLFDRSWPGLEAAERLGRPHRAVWYRRVYPTNLPADASVSVDAPEHHDSTCHVRLTVVVPTLSAGLNWIVDEGGHSVRGTLRPTTYWTAHQADLPDAGEFGLGPLHDGTDDISRP